MRLASFVESNREVILSEWEAFARSLGTEADQIARSFDRHQAKLMLIRIVTHMALPDTKERWEEAIRNKSRNEKAAAAAHHGTARFADGVSLLELVAEFRALRACVLRLWLPTINAADPQSMDDVLRFNEALDQAMSESVATFFGRRW